VSTASSSARTATRRGGRGSQKESETSATGPTTNISSTLHAYSASSPPPLQVAVRIGQVPKKGTETGSSIHPSFPLNEARSIKKSIHPSTRPAQKAQKLHAVARSKFDEHLTITHGTAQFVPKEKNNDDELVIVYDMVTKASTLLYKVQTRERESRKTWGGRRTS
jgi:hypothetical protein